MLTTRPVGRGWQKVLMFEGHFHGLSSAYTTADVDRLLERLDAALQQVAAGE